MGNYYIKNSDFVNLEGESGGAVYFSLNEGSSNIHVSFSSFILCRSNGSGGAILSLGGKFQENNICGYFCYTIKDGSFSLSRPFNYDSTHKFSMVSSLNCGRNIESRAFCIYRGQITIRDINSTNSAAVGYGAFAMEPYGINGRLNAQFVQISNATGRYIINFYNGISIASNFVINLCYNYSFLIRVDTGQLNISYSEFANNEKDGYAFLSTQKGVAYIEYCYIDQDLSIDLGRVCYRNERMTRSLRSEIPYETSPQIRGHLIFLPSSSSRSIPSRRTRFVKTKYLLSFT